MSRDPAARYANLRGKVDKAMDNINLMKSASRYEYGNATPPRQSRSPPRNKDLDEMNDSFAGARNRATAPMTETAGGRRINRSPLRNTNQSYEYYPATVQKRTVAPQPPMPSSDLLAQIDTL